MYNSVVGGKKKKKRSTFLQEVFCVGRIQLFAVQDDSFCQKYQTFFFSRGDREKKKLNGKKTAEMEGLGGKNREVMVKRKNEEKEVMVEKKELCRIRRGLSRTCSG